MFWGAVGYWQTNFFKPHLDYFRGEDTTNPLGANLGGYYPRPLENDRNRNPQTRYLQNAAYCRLKNVTLGYTLPKSFDRKILRQQSAILCFSREFIYYYQSGRYV